MRAGRAGVIAPKEVPPSHPASLYRDLTIIRDSKSIDGIAILRQINVFTILLEKKAKKIQRNPGLGHLAALVKRAM